MIDIFPLAVVSVLFIGILALLYIGLRWTTKRRLELNEDQARRLRR